MFGGGDRDYVGGEIALIPLIPLSNEVCRGEHFRFLCSMNFSISALFLQITSHFYRSGGEEVNRDDLFLFYPTQILLVKICIIEQLLQARNLGIN